MKKTIILACVAAFFIFFIGIQEGLAVMKQAPAASPAKQQVQTPPAVKQKEQVASPIKQEKPDLTVTVKFVHTETWTREDGSQCYSPRPEFTIKNRGRSDANNFDYKIEWKLGPGNTWQVYSTSNPSVPLSLAPGATETINGNQPTWDQPWCTDKPDWIPGWRISVDTKNGVAESNENNNVAEKMYEPSLMIKQETPKAMQKEISPPPVQKRTPIQMR